jgi:hypothetical protein
MPKFTREGGTGARKGGMGEREREGGSGFCARGVFDMGALCVLLAAIERSLDTIAMSV